MVLWNYPIGALNDFLRNAWLNYYFHLIFNVAEINASNSSMHGATSEHDNAKQCACNVMI